MNPNRSIDAPLAIIPARGGSKRFPGKHLALFKGSPLIGHAVKTAIESNVFHKICVTSDDLEILKVAEDYGADILIRRADHLATDTIQVKKVVHELLESLLSKGNQYKYFGLLLATSPLRLAEDIRSAFQIFQQPGTNSVMSVMAFVHPPHRAVWFPKGYIEPYWGQEYMKRTQDLDTLYEDDGSIYFGTVDVFLKEKEFYGSKVRPYVIPEDRSVDIDTPEGLEWATFLANRSCS